MPTAISAISRQFQKPSWVTMACHQAEAVTLSGPGAVGATEVEVEISPGPRKGSRSLETLEFQASLEADKVQREERACH